MPSRVNGPDRSVLSSYARQNELRHTGSVVVDDLVGGAWRYRPSVLELRSSGNSFEDTCYAAGFPLVCQ